MFSDALLFDMVLKTAFEDGVETIQDLIDRDMLLSIRYKLNKNGNQSVKTFSSCARSAGASLQYENLQLHTLPSARNNYQMLIDKVDKVGLSR